MIITSPPQIPPKPADPEPAKPEPAEEAPKPEPSKAPSAPTPEPEPEPMDDSSEEGRHFTTSHHFLASVILRSFGGKIGIFD